MSVSLRYQRMYTALVVLIVLSLAFVGMTALRSVTAAGLGLPASSNQPNATPDGTPSITETTPAANATFVRRDIFVAATVKLPNVGAGVNAATLTAANVRLVRTSDNFQVSATVNTSGGGDIIVLDPNNPLSAFTSYTFIVTSGVQDTSGAAFTPYSMTFSTGSAGGPAPSSNIEFEQVPLLDTVNTEGYTTLQMGPDSKLYATTIDGRIVRFELNSDGTTGISQTITTIQTYAPPAKGSSNRMLIGFVFDPSSTADNLIAWASHSHYTLVNGQNWTGKITRLSGPNLEVAEDYVVGLPRSYKDHLSNSLIFKPGDPNNLYMTQGSNSAMGGADPVWGQREESLLSAAVLRINIGNITTPPVNVKTAEGGTYNPFAVGAPVTLFATGIRNGYDLVWHTNGELYVPTNGSAAGGSTPATPDDIANTPACKRRIDGKSYTEPVVSGLITVTTQPDFLYRVKLNKYYGHPNPTRCEWVLNGGNPTSNVDIAEIVGSPTYPVSYTVGTMPDRNWGNISYNFGNNKSPNGIIEYRNGRFNGALRGKLLVVRYSGGNDIIALTPGAPNKDIVAAQTNIAGFTGLNDPLDLIENRNNGNLYVSEYGARRIMLLRPVTRPSPSAQIGPTRRIFNDVQGGSASPAQTFVISNTGTATLTITNLLLAGASFDVSQFSIVSQPSLPYTLAPGESVPVGVVFNPTTTGPRGALLQVHTNDSSAPVIEGVLRGLGTAGTSGTNEPSLQWVMDTYEIPLNVGDDAPNTNIIHSTNYASPSLGQEIPVGYFIKAGSEAVSVEPIAVFGPKDNNGGSNAVYFGWNSTGNANSTQELFAINNTYNQSLNPVPVGQTSFNPGQEAFGFYSRWPFFNNRRVYSEDALNTFTGAIPHHVRVYPLNSDGVPVPNTYIVVTEETTSGYDYQDIVVIVRNVIPIRIPTDVNVKINFQSPDAPVPDGYLRDFGQPFGARSLARQGDGTLVYGWVDPNDSHPRSPRDLSVGGSKPGNGRDRDINFTDQRLDTFMHMQADDIPGFSDGTPLPGAWEMVVPDGTYKVIVAVGDPLGATTAEQHTINVEGVNAINNFVSTGSSGSMSRHKTVELWVPVTDGRLTVDAKGGFNTKINYIEIVKWDQPIPTVSPTPAATSTTETPVATATATNAPPSTTPTVLGATATSTTPTVPAATATPVTVMPTATQSATQNQRLWLPLLSKAGQSGGGQSLSSGTKGMYRPIDGLQSTQNESVRAINESNWLTKLLQVISAMQAGQNLAAACGSTGNISVSNLDTDNIPFEDRLAFTRIQDPLTAADNYNWVRDTGTVRVRNTGVGSLTISDVTINGPWQLSNTLNLPTTLAPNSFVDVSVRFVAQAAPQLRTGSLIIQSNDADEPNKEIELAGWWQSKSENNEEPNLQEVVNIMGYNIVIARNGQSINNQGEVEAVGDEILSPYWVRVDGSKPVRAFQLAALHQCCKSGATIFWHPKGDTTNVNYGITHARPDGQTLLPRKINGQTLATATFNPTGAFGFKVDGSEWSDPTLNNQSKDISSGCPGPCGHHIRFWPVRDRQGVLIPNTYLMVMDYAGINYDYNDNMYLVTNVRPEVAAADTLTPATAVGDPGLVLDFNQSYPGTLADKDGQTTGFRDTQRNRGDNTRSAPSTSYVAGNVDINTGGAGTLTITTTTGSNPSTDNTQVNAMCLPFDGRTSRFIISGKIVGPLTNFTTSGQQAGVMFGPEQDNFFKAVLVGRTGTSPAIRVISEDNTSSSQLGGDVGVPNAANVATLELMLLGDPQTGVVQTAYRLTYSDGTPDTGMVFLPTKTTLTGIRRNRFFDRKSQGCLFTTNKGTTSINVAYDRFAITSGENTSARPNLWRIDVAGAANYTDTNGNVWQPDTGLFTPSGAIAENGGSPAPAIANTNDDTLYQTYRGNVGNASRTITYNLSIPGQVQKVDLRLHFAELYWGAPNRGPGGTGRRVFDVRAEGTTIIDDFDITAASGGALNAAIVPVEGITVTNGMLTLEFDAERDYASIAAIEVFASSVNGNVPPASNAGADQQVGLGSNVTLTGTSGDYDNNNPLTVSWTQIGGPAVSLSGSGNTRTFTAPNASTSLTFKFTVTDAGGLSTSDTVVINVGDTPVSGLIASSNSPSSPNDAVTFTASVGCGTNVTYKWNFGDNTPVVNGGGTITHAYAAEGNYTVTVTAMNGVSSTSTTVAVKILPLLTRINSGGPSVTTPDGIGWSADNSIANFANTEAKENTSIADILNTTNDILYLNERTSNTSTGAVNYAIAVPTAGQYTVRLHFAEIYWGATNGGAGGAGRRVFSANLEGGTVELSNYDLNASVGSMTAVTKLYVVTVNDGVLNLDLSATADRPTIAAIEVFGASGMVFPTPTVIPTSTPSGPFSLKVNFQTNTALVPAGYVRDFGQGYGLRTLPDQGTGLSYGWVAPGTNTPADLTAEGRERALNPDKRLDTLVHMQRLTAGAWEVAVPNGTYDVTVAVGDADVSGAAMIHHINIEGVNAINQFVPSGANGAATLHSINTVRVVVSDGRLTVDAIGGTNTKINYLDIAQTTTGETTVPTPTATATSTPIPGTATATATGTLPTATATSPVTQTPTSTVGTPTATVTGTVPTPTASGTPGTTNNRIFLPLIIKAGTAGGQQGKPLQVGSNCQPGAIVNKVVTFFGAFRRSIPSVGQTTSIPCQELSAMIIQR